MKSSKHIKLSLPPLNEIEKEILRRKLKRSHLEFTKHFFRKAQNTAFQVGAFHKVICDTLDKVYSGEISRLIINMPPGYSKTEVAVINFMAHGFAINPGARFIHASYADTLALDNSSKARDLVSLQAFQDLWPLQLKTDSSAKGLWRTDAGGHVRAAAAGMPITGFRAGRLLGVPEGMDDVEDWTGPVEQVPWQFTGALIIDDPLKPDDAASATTRDFINQRWQNTFRSRLGDERVPVIIVMQRLHVDDFVAHVLETSGEEWHVLKLPIEIDGECEPIHPKAIMIEHGLPPGPLWLPKHNQEQINILKLSGSVYAAQYAQDPIAVGGNLFKDEWFGEYEDLPPLLWRAIYVDTAQKTKERNDYSVFEHWGRGKNGKAYLLDLVRARLEAPELEKTALSFWAKAKGVDPTKMGYLRVMKIEDKVSGTGLIQSLKRKNIPVVAIQRERDKYTRALDVVPLCAVGNVVLPKTAPWLRDFRGELAAFPDGAFDDQVDPFMDAVLDMCGTSAYSLDNVG